jgi:hypothetical protein
MTDADDLPTEHPILATTLTAAVGAIGYVLPTAVFGRPIEPAPTLAFAAGFAVLYMGLAALQRRYPELQDL